MVWEEMVRYQRLKGYPPSVAHIASVIGVAGPLIHNRLSRLVKRGWVVKIPSNLANPNCRRHCYVAVTGRPVED